MRVCEATLTAAHNCGKGHQVFHTFHPSSQAKTTAFVIGHNFIMATHRTDGVIVFEGTPTVAAAAIPFFWLLSFDL